MLVNDISQTSRQWLHHAAGSGCHLLIASGRGPTELWEITKVAMCIFTSEWPQVGTTRCSEQAKSFDDSLQTLETDFCMNYLIETKEIFFFCTYFCNKTELSHWMSKRFHQSLEITTNGKKHARMRKQQSHRRHTVFEQTFWDTLIFYFILFFGSRI